MMLSMQPGSLDTSIESEQILIQGFRKMPARDKFRRVVELTDLVHKLAMNEIRRRHPDADDKRLRLYLLSRWVSPQLLKKAFGWDIQKEGF